MTTVSIICTNYNKGEWLREAIESFLKQETTFDTEIILVDDASTDQSPNIIKEYQELYPHKIRAFFHATNQGITKTWKSICLEATGEYIARCDGDDFWTDPYKLQKQMDLLLSQPEAGWSTTDFDLVDTAGVLVQKNTLKSGSLPIMNSYEEMLALKGMTMSSTWLVRKELMLEANAAISDDAVDDTFNLQLELFQRSKRAFLEESTTVYRIVPSSDSRPEDSEHLERRLCGIYQTQQEYLKKFPEANFIQMVDLQAKQDIQQELRYFQAETIAKQQAQVLDEQVRVVANLKCEMDRMVAEYGHLLDQYNRVITSRRWTIPSKLIGLLRSQNK